MNRLSTYRWLPGRTGARSSIAISESLYARFRTAVLITGFRLFFLFAPSGASTRS